MPADSTNGNIGGLDGANTICQTNASNASLPEDVSQHLAVLATSSSHPKDMFDNDPPVKRPDQTSIIGSWEGFFDLDITLETSATPSFAGVFTGLTGTGEQSSYTCSDWTSAIGRTGAGVSNNLDTERLFSANVDCSSQYQLYCVSF